MAEESGYQLAEKAALRLIARAEQCSAGLSRKLEKRKHDAVVVSEVISNLIKLKLLDDNRFARLWLESRIRLTRSPRQLLSSLCAKGINRDEAEAALKNVLDDETELSIIIRYVKKNAKKISKNGDVTRESRQSSQRSIKYMLRNEGFSFAVIDRYLEENF